MAEKLYWHGWRLRAATYTAVGALKTYYYADRYGVMISWDTLRSYRLVCLRSGCQEDYSQPSFKF